MPYNGVGVFQRVYQWETDAANGIFVDATRTDTDSNDIAAGLTNCVTRDGQSPWLANLPAAGFKITGLGAGSNPNDSVNYGQVFVNPTFTGLNATGTVNFAGATTVTVPTVTLGDNSTNAASTAFVQGTAFASALPNQTGNAGKWVVTDGTNASWTDTYTIAVNEAKGADIASASTINLTTATGNLVHVTGTTTITAITIPSGAERTVVFDGILTLTYNATTLILPTLANITTAAGDTMVVRGDGSGNARVISYERANGRSLVPAGWVLIAPPISVSAVANIDALSVFLPAYDSYRIIGTGIKPASDDAPSMRVAVAGAADTGSNYMFQNAVNSTATATQTRFQLTNNAVNVISSGKGIDFDVTLMNVNDTSDLKSFFCMSQLQDVNTPSYRFSVIGGTHTPANALTGVRFFWNGGSNFAAAGEIRIYGLLNSNS